MKIIQWICGKILGHPKIKPHEFNHYLRPYTFFCKICNKELK